MVVEETITLTSDTSDTSDATGATTRPRIPGQRTAPQATLLEHAVRYAQERAWDVFPGTWLETVDGVPRCSCGERACPAPGAHPARARWADETTGSATTVRRLWATEPRAAVLLPTGRAFDALEVPETAGCLALTRLERMAQPLGPVTCTPDGRMLFFVLPGVAAKAPATLRRLGWSPSALDLRTKSAGDWVAAPPTRLGTRGAVQWAREPNAANRWLPDVDELLPTLAYACGREAAGRAVRTAPDSAARSAADGPGRTAAGPAGPADRTATGSPTATGPAPGAPGGPPPGPVPGAGPRAHPARNGPAAAPYRVAGTAAAAR